MTEEPRVRFQCCNAMYMVLSHLIETLTGKWLGDFLHERIWAPLGMDRTIFSIQQAQEAVDRGDAEFGERVYME